MQEGGGEEWCETSILCIYMRFLLLEPSRLLLVVFTAFARGGFPPVPTAGLAPETSQAKAWGSSDAAGGGPWCISKQIGGCLAIAGRGRTPSAG